MYSYIFCRRYTIHYYTRTHAHTHSHSSIHFGCINKGRINNGRIWRRQYGYICQTCDESSLFISPFFLLTVLAYRHMLVSDQLTIATSCSRLWSQDHHNIIIMANTGNSTSWHAKVGAHFLSLTTITDTYTVHHDYCLHAMCLCMVMVWGGEGGGGGGDHC